MNKRWSCILFSLLLIITVTACNTQAAPSEENSTIESNISASSESESAAPEKTNASNSSISNSGTSKIQENDFTNVEVVIPFGYTLSGDKLSDNQIKTGFQSLYQSAHEVFYWYLNDSGALETDFNMPAVEDDQGEKWYPVTKLHTLSELKQLTESVFSQRYAQKKFYKLRRFDNINGKLYERAGGGLGDSHIPDFSSLEILSKSPEKIMLCMDIDAELAVDEIKKEKIKFTLRLS